MLRAVTEVNLNHLAIRGVYIKFVESFGFRSKLEIRKTPKQNDNEYGTFEEDSNGE